MGDRLSDSSYDGIAEEAEVAIKADVKSFQQLSSSAEAAKANRLKNAISSLDSAAKKAKQEQGGNAGQK
jgi:hypothetical protein